MRLIDADKFKEQVAGACIKNGFGKSVGKAGVMLELIDLQPTVDEKEIIRKAFERVVEELKEAREKQIPQTPCIECEHCIDVEDHYKPMTNADRIRNMTDEELAEFLTGEVNTVVNCGDCDEPESEYGSCIGDCKNPYLKWLQAEVKEGERDADS